MVFETMTEENRDKDLWQAIGEQDVTKLRNKLENIRKLSDQRFKNYRMNTSEQEGTLN